MRYISEVTDLRGKRVLVRVDFNVENADDAFRLRASLPTITYLLKGGAKVLLMSHRGRPKGKVVPEFSLLPMLDFLKKNAHPGAVFLPDFDFAGIKKQIESAPEGALFLLENIRFLPGEEGCDPALAKDLASLGEIYVNDQIAVSHREGATITLLPKLLPAYAGFLLAAEIKNLSQAMVDPQQPLVVIVGGGKAVDKFGVIKNLHDRASKFLIGGVLANTFFKAKGVNVGASRVDEEIMEDVAAHLNDPKVMLPADWVTGEGGSILDIGPQATTQFCEVIAHAKTIIWSGPVGLFEDPRYLLGSAALAKAVTESGAFSVVGGSETTQLLTQLKLEDKISFMSTGGSAMLDFLAGRKLPGIEALN